MKNIKDIWFRTEIELQELAEKIGLENSFYDAENYWEWVIGKYKSLKLDVTRSHKVEPIETETRIFILDGGNFSEEHLSEIVPKLKSIGIVNIILGRWEYITGNEYKMHEDRRIP